MFKRKPEKDKKLSKKGLENLCDHQKKQIKRLRTLNREQKKSFYNQIETFLQQYANESKMSYIVIRGLNKVVAATPSFVKRFKFSEEMLGSNCYNRLKNPLDDLTQTDFQEVFTNNPEEIEKTAIIRDGDGKNRYVVLTKEKPIQCENEYYTRVQIYEIGAVKGTVKGLRRILGLNGEPKTLAGYVARKKANNIKEQVHQEANGIIRETEFDMQEFEKGIKK